MGKITIPVVIATERARDNGILSCYKLLHDMHLVIVESPTKAKTIGRFLGKDYAVYASMGHVRDLPESSSAVPEKYKKTAYGQLGVDVEHDFTPLYVIPSGKTKVIQELKRALKGAEDVYLATDEDREGESISWHLLQILKPTIPVHRMVFHEITKEAIEGALRHPRTLDERLVRAQETRRILDRLVGYTISPVLWKKITYGLSAGRVQSATLKAAVDRERRRMVFAKSSFWDVVAEFTKNGDRFEARLTSTRGKRLATGKDFDEETGELKAKEKDRVMVLAEVEAKEIAKSVKTAKWQVEDVVKKSVTKRPSPPFITSTLQQEANRKLGLSSKETMRLAQNLYERGFITYMRTDSTALAEDAIKAARSHIASRFGATYLPPSPRRYATTSTGAQEAHEAIRPSLAFAAPDAIDATAAERALYEMIWMRTLASQMADSEQEQIAATFCVETHIFAANGMKILFPGFLRAYCEGTEDVDQALNQKERPLPEMKKGDVFCCENTEAESHETKPPARFTEASLIQFMEKEGIGRPSTYASVISTLTDRGYVRKTGNALVPTFTAFVVTQFMEKHFADLVDVGFTSKMEESLDAIAEGKQERLPYLRAFYLGEHGLEKKVSEEYQAKDAEDARRLVLPSAPDIEVKVGRFGPYFETLHPKSRTTIKASIPVDAAPANFTPEYIHELLEKAQQGPTSLGQDPKTKKYIFLKTGSYGPYLQLGEDPEEGSKEKPKRISIPKNIPLETLDREKALALLSLPRLLGTHPNTGKDIRAGLGRFGPYVVCDGDFRSIKEPENVLTITLARALELLAVPKSGRRGATATLKTLGPHPKDQKPITLHHGKYGLFVKHGKTNATLPKNLKPEDVTLEQALVSLTEKREKKRKKK